MVFCTACANFSSNPRRIHSGQKDKDVLTKSHCLYFITAQKGPDLLAGRHGAVSNYWCP